jgi:hypothetical protein
LKIGERNEFTVELRKQGSLMAITARDYAQTKVQQALAAANMGNWLRVCRRNFDAAESFLKAASLFEEMDDQPRMALSLLSRGLAMIEQGLPEDAKAPISRARKVFAMNGDSEREKFASELLSSLSGNRSTGP